MKIIAEKEFTPIKLADFITTASNTSKINNIRVLFRNEINNEWIPVVTNDTDELLFKFGDYLVARFENELNISEDSISPVLTVYIAKSIEFEKISSIEDTLREIFKEFNNGTKDLSDAVHEAIGVIYHDY